MNKVPRELEYAEKTKVLIPFVMAALLKVDTTTSEHSTIIIAAKGTNSLLQDAKSILFF